MLLVTFHKLNRFGKFLDSLSPIYKIIIAKIIFDIFLFGLVYLVGKSDLYGYVFGLNGTLILVYLINVGEAEMTFVGLLKFMFKKKE